MDNNTPDKEAPVTIVRSSVLLSLRDIAGWQLPSVAPENAQVHAELPALQRGAVWSAPQVEALWDSVLRGFPVGAFLLAPFQAERGKKDYRFRVEGGGAREPTHHLLDGQQRSNALTLGFLDPWKVAEAPAVLWLDLQPPPASDDREFVLRLVTRAHPWGYRYNTLASGGPRLAMAAIRDAVVAYEKATPGLGRKTGGHIPLTHAWPWDAHAPVPLCFLLDAIERGGDVRGHLVERLTSLPFWNGEVVNLHGEGWKTRVLEILNASSGSRFDYLHRILSSARGLLGVEEAASYRIPGLVLPQLEKTLSGPATRRTVSEDQAVQQDAIETLFIRINSNGTLLSGEELSYSILKSIWPDAERFIQQMDVRLAPPSRLVTLASRLILAREPTARQKPPAAPDVARFRRLIHGVDRDCKGFQVKLVRFFQSGEATEIFGAARELLTKGNGERLPPILAADIARKAQDVMFLLLRWVDRMIKQEHHPGSLNGESTHRVLGAVTALAWFAEDHGRCLSALWEPLQSAGGNALRSFFRAPTFSRAYRLTRGKLALVPLVPPKTLEQAIEANVFGHGFYTPDGPLWQSWTWERLTDSALDDHRRFGGQLDRWYRRSFKSIWEDADQAENPEAEEDLDLRGIRQQAWRAFIDKLWGEKSLLLFAQRKWIHRWFENYDPTNVDPLDEADRPWDFDHIHPASHIESKRNIPQRIRAWHGSIGNLRAWPLQANRGDGASSPWTKLSSDRALEMLQPFGITTHEQLADASFLNEEERSYFEGSTPDDDTFVSGYLGRPAEFGKQRIQLVNAIVRRWLRLYRSWYEALRIEDLGP